MKGIRKKWINRRILISKILPSLHTNFVIFHFIIYFICNFQHKNDQKILTFLLRNTILTGLTERYSIWLAERNICRKKLEIELKMQKYFAFDFQMKIKYETLSRAPTRIMKGIKWFINAYIFETVALFGISRFKSRRDANGPQKKI